MKKLIIVAIALFTVNISIASNPVKPNANLRNEITSLLDFDVPFEISENIIEVIFTVNSKNELIIISTNASDENSLKFIKNKLNYKKVNFKATKSGELYLLPIKFKKS